LYKFIVGNFDNITEGVILWEIGFNRCLNLNDLNNELNVISILYYSINQDDLWNYRKLSVVVQK